jgi:hypothetical protein
MENPWNNRRKPFGLGDNDKFIGICNFLAPVRTYGRQQLQLALSIMEFSNAVN